MCTRVAHSQSIVEPGERVVPETIPYEKNIAKYVMMPGNAIRRHPVVEERTRKLIEYGNHCDFNRVEMGDTKLGIITSSTCYQYAKEVFGDKASILKIGLVNPLPDQLILDFAAKVEKLAIIEELDPILENHCKELGLTVTGKDALPMEGEFSQNLIAEKLGIEVPAHKELGEALPGRPPVMCAGCPHRGVFYDLHKLKLQVSGDIGCYTLGAVAPLNSMDTTICMGASVGVAMGMAKARGNDFAKKTVSVIGDSTFIHSGITGLIDVVYNKGINTIIILDNSITGMTGHQDNPTTGYTIRKEVTKQVNLVTLCKSVGVERIAIVDPFDVKQMEAVVKQEIAAEEPSVIIAQRPCALLKTVKYTGCCEISTDCKKCKLCMKLGCPAISFDGTRPTINPTQCNGCGLCLNVCPFGCIHKKEEA